MKNTNNVGAKMAPWHITSDFPQSLTAKPGNGVNGSESASTLSSVSPLMPTCGNLPQALQVLSAPFLPARGLPVQMSLQHRLLSQIYPQNSRGNSAGLTTSFPKSTKTVRGGGL